MNEEERFLSAIIQEPDDEPCRLVFADWLEEQGNPRAAMLRASVEVWRLARKARIPPHIFGDLHRARKRLLRRDRDGSTQGWERLWACACVRFLRLPGDRRLGAQLPPAMMRWLAGCELGACELPVPEAVRLPPADETARLTRCAVGFVNGYLVREFFAEVGVIAAQEDLPEHLLARAADRPAAQRQNKHAYKWCVGLAERVFKLAARSE
jgi:uncharacterized protein (TIGR02996 family)